MVCGTWHGLWNLTWSVELDMVWELGMVWELSNALEFIGVQLGFFDTQLGLGFYGC